MTAHVVIVGSINADLSLACTRLPSPGETVLASGIKRSPGGKGANQAVAAARAGGARTSMVGAVGDDPDGEKLLGRLESDGIDVSAVSTLSGEPTGLAVISVDERGENTIVVVPGANSALALNDSADSAIAAADVVLAQLEVPQQVVALAAQRRRSGVPFLLNAAPAATLTEELAAQVDLLIVNEHEALVTAGVDDQAEALALLAGRFPAVLVTLGDRGSVLRRKGQEDVRILATKVTALDTTAAGDTFCGVLAASIADSAGIEQAMQLATTASALSVQRRGAQESVPTADEVRRAATVLADG